MNLEVLISTMNINSIEENNNLIKKMNIKGNYLTISQTNKKGVEKNIIYDDKRGLSKSRNMAIKNANSDIIVIADDDVTYLDDYENIIKQAYKENPKADMIAFYVESTNPKRKIRKLRTGKVGFIEIFRVCSCQLTFKLDSIKKNNLVFDENFGAGTKNYCGEETIFLRDCLKKKMKLFYVNKKIGTVEQKESTWFDKKGKEYIQVEKECFKRISPKFWWILLCQFVVRKKVLKLFQSHSKTM